MRYCVTNWTVAIFFLVCGMSVGIPGCTTDPNEMHNDVKVERNVKAKETAARELAAKELAAKELAAKELAGKELAEKNFDAKDSEPPEIPGNESPAKEVSGTEITAVLAQATKIKDKTKGKETTKEPAKESPKEPKFDFKEPSEVGGKTFQEWMKLMKHTDPVRREEAMKYVTAFGPTKSHEALPEIIIQLNRHKTEPNGVDLSVRVNGIMALTMIYRQMAMAKKDPPEESHKKAFALYKYFLNDGQVIMRVRTLQGLPSLGPIARDAIPDVIKSTTATITWEVRKEALQTLTLIARDAKGVPDPKVMPELRNRAKNDISYVVRQTALEGLAMLSAPKVPPELIHALDVDPAVQVRLKVLDLLGKLEKDMEDNDRKLALKKLNAHLSVERDPILLVWTHGTIMTLMKKVTSAHMYPVVNYVKDKDPAVRVQALTMIGLGGKDAKQFAQKEVLDELHKCLPPENGKKFEYPDVNVAVAAMKAAVGIHAFEAVPVLEKIHKDRNAPEFLEVNAGKALDAFEQLKAHLETKDKKDKDKKTPEN